MRSDETMKPTTLKTTAIFLTMLMFAAAALPGGEVQQDPPKKELSAAEKDFVGVWRNIYRETHGTEPSYYLTKGIRITYDDYLIPAPEGTIFRFFDDGTFYRTFNIQTNYGSRTYTYTMIEKGVWSATGDTVHLTVHAFKDMRTAGFRTDWTPWRPPLNPKQPMKVGFGNDNDDRGAYFEVYAGIVENDKWFDKKYHKANISAIDAEDFGSNADKPDAEPVRKTGKGSLVGVWRNIYKETHGTEPSYYMTEGIQKTKDGHLIATPEGTIYYFYDDGTFYRSLNETTSLVSENVVRTNSYTMIEKGSWRESEGTVSLAIEAFKDLTTHGMKDDFTPWRTPFIQSQTLEIGFGNDNDGRGEYFEIYEGLEWYSMWFDYKYHKVDLSKITGGEFGTEK